MEIKFDTKKGSVVVKYWCYVMVSFQLANIEHKIEKPPVRSH